MDKLLTSILLEKLTKLKNQIQKLTYFQNFQNLIARLER